MVFGATGLQKTFFLKKGEAMKHFQLYDCVQQRMGYILKKNSVFNSEIKVLNLIFNLEIGTLFF